MTLCTRPLVDGDFSRNLLAQFLTDILSVPALIYHLNNSAPKCIEQMSSMWILKRSLTISEDINWFKDFGEKLPVSTCSSLEVLLYFQELHYLS